MRNVIRLCTLVALLLLVGGCQTYDAAPDLAALDTLLADFEGYVVAGDVDGIMSQYSTALDPEMYGVYGEVKGNDAIRQGWEQFFATTKVTAAKLTPRPHMMERKFAVSSGLWTMTLETPEGSKELSGRFTNVIGKREGKWELLKVHASVAMPTAGHSLAEVAEGGEAPAE